MAAGLALAIRHAEFRDTVGSLGRWPVRRWVVAVVAGVIAALVIGIPTGVVPTPIYTRMLPTTWWDYPVWAASAIVIGLIAATYVRAEFSTQQRERTGSLFGGGVLSLFAVGCPICNKLVVAAIGATGALDYFAPVQPILGVGALALLVVTLNFRLRGELSCPVAPA